MKPLPLFFPLFAAMILCANASAHAQRQALRNPAESSSFWLTSLNPAAMSFQHSLLSAGTEVLHATFVPERALGLSEHRLHLTFPYWLPYDLALGFDVRSFNAPIYSEIEANVLVSKKIISALALGVKLGLEGRAFDRSQFTLVDPNDPLLQGNSLRRNAPNLGVSAFYNAGALTLGASLDHVYQPNLAYGATALQPRFMTFGLAYDLGLFAPSLTWNHDGAQQLLGFELAAEVSKLAALRFSYERAGPIRMEAQFHIHRNAKFAYGVDFPGGEISGASNGTHELAYQHVLGREPEIGAPLLVLSTSRMNVTIERWQRIVEPGVPLEVISALPSMSAEYLDPNEQLGNLMVVPLVGLAEQLPNEHLRHAQRELGRAVAFTAQEVAANNIALRVASGASEQARAFEKILRQEMNGSAARILVGYQKTRGQVSLSEFRPGQVTLEERAPALSHEEVAINIVVPGARRIVQAWRLDILAPNNEAVKSFAGKETLPTMLAWDWRNAARQIVAAGQYRCRLVVTSKAGKQYSAKADIEVTRTQREVTLRIAKQPKTNAPQSLRSETKARPEKWRTEE
jgi:hypothetical protein